MLNDSLRTYCPQNTKYLSDWRSMADRFNIVPIGIKNKRTIIVRVVMWSKAGCSVVYSACPDSSSMEGIDVGSALGLQGDVK